MDRHQAARGVGDWGNDVIPASVNGANVEITFTSTDLGIYGPVNTVALGINVDVKAAGGNYGVPTSITLPAQKIHSLR